MQTLSLHGKVKSGRLLISPSHFLVFLYILAFMFMMTMSLINTKRHSYGSFQTIYCTQLSCTCFMLISKEQLKRSFQNLCLCTEKLKFLELDKQCDWNLMTRAAVWRLVMFLCHPPSLVTVQAPGHPLHTLGLHTVFNLAPDHQCRVSHFPHSPLDTWPPWVNLPLQDMCPRYFYSSAFHTKL